MAKAPKAAKSTKISAKDGKEMRKELKKESAEIAVQDAGLKSMGYKKGGAVKPKGKGYAEGGAVKTGLNSATKKENEVARSKDRAKMLQDRANADRAAKGMGPIPSKGYACGGKVKK